MIPKNIKEAKQLVSKYIVIANRLQENKEYLNEVIKKKEKLYKKISTIRSDIFDLNESTLKETYINIDGVTCLKEVHIIVSNETKFGSAGCSLCMAVDNCSECLYNYFNMKKEGLSVSSRCLQHRSYYHIKNSRSIEYLIIALRERATFILTLTREIEGDI